MPIAKWRSKPGAALTITNSLTTCSTLSKSSIVAMMEERQMSMACLAA